MLLRKQASQESAVPSMSIQDGKNTPAVLSSSAAPRAGIESLESIIIICSRPVGLDAITSLKDQLQGLCKKEISVLPFDQITEMNLAPHHCNFVDDIEHTMLSDPSENGFANLQLLCKARGLLWVVQRACNGRKSPEGSLTVGLARSIRNENDNITFATLDLDIDDRLGEARTGDFIGEVFKAAMISPPFSPERDNEYRERKVRSTYLVSSTTLAPIAMLRNRLVKLLLDYNHSFRMIGPSSCLCGELAISILSSISTIRAQSLRCRMTTSRYRCRLREWGSMTCLLQLQRFLVTNLEKNAAEQ